MYVVVLHRIKNAEAAFSRGEKLMKNVGATRGIPVLVNMHDVELARRFADRVVGMSGGKIVYDGPSQYLTDDVLKSIYGGEGWLH